MKANILDKGALDISVSSNYGVTYYTDDISTLTEVPKEAKDLMYTAQKDVGVENGRRQLFVCLLAIPAFIIAVVVIDLVVCALVD